MYARPYTRPTTAAAMIFPVTITVLFIGSVSRVSRVLFSFSDPMELMTMLPTIMMMIMITIGTIIVCDETWLEISDGVTPRT